MTKGNSNIETCDVTAKTFEISHIKKCKTKHDPF
jgi:hypothetical protein